MAFCPGLSSNFHLLEIFSPILTLETVAAFSCLDVCQPSVSHVIVLLRILGQRESVSGASGIKTSSSQQASDLQIQIGAPKPADHLQRTLPVSNGFWKEDCS
jgi:hypothetical protein